MSRYPQWVEDLYTKATAAPPVPAPGADPTPAKLSDMTTLTISPDTRTPERLSDHGATDPRHSSQNPRQPSQNFSRGSAQRLLSDGSDASVEISSVLSADEINAFLARNFSDVKPEEVVAAEGAAKKTYRVNKLENITLTEEQMIRLIQAYPRTKQLPDSVATQIKNFLTGELAPQVLNLLEVTALLTAIWVQKPEYVAGLAPWAAMSCLGAMTIWVNHLYYGLVAGKTRDEVKETIRVGDEVVLQMLMLIVLECAVSDFPSVKKALFSALTQPHFGSRLAQELRSFSSCSVKVIAAFALFFQINKQMQLNLSLYMLSLFALTAGMVQGVDMGFSNTIAISHEHQKFSEFSRGLIPPDLNDRGFKIFLRLANFAFFPWLMATSGPAMWATIKFMASKTFFDLISEKSNQVHGGLLGAEMIVGMSSMYFAYIFLMYNILEKLAKELPTKRTFELREGTFLNHIGQATIATLPVDAVAAFIAHQFFGYGIKDAVIIASPVAVVTMSAILNSKIFAKYYSYFTRMGFVGDVVNKLDAIDIKDKIAAFILGLATAGFGTYKDHEIIAATGQLLTFLTVTMLAAEYSRQLAGALRFIPAQMALYAAALITWQLVFIEHMKNPRTGNFPAHLSHERQGDWYYPNVVGALIAAMGAGFGDHKAQNMKVSEVQKPIEPEEHFPSFLGLMGQTMWNLASKVPKLCRKSSSDLESPIISMATNLGEKEPLL